MGIRTREKKEHKSNGKCSHENRTHHNNESLLKVSFDYWKCDDCKEEFFFVQ